MSRPSAEDVDEALNIVTSAKAHSTDEWVAALELLRKAVKPRTVWLRKEVAEELGVKGSNVDGPRGVRGLPAPIQELPRPTSAHADGTLKLWDADEVREFAARRRAERTER